MDKKLQRQINLQVSGLCIREAEDGQKSRTIEGHAVVFGVRSVNLTPWSSWRELYEVMEPGCITQDLLNRSDVVLTAFHNNQMILGRWREGKGTLTLELDGRGLKIRCTLAETATADELLSAIERGDISGMSFAFIADEDDSENGVSYEHVRSEDHDGYEVWVRHVKRVTELYDVTIAGHPAYPQTDIEQREVDEFLDKHIKRDNQETDEEREAREKAEREQAEREANGGETNAEKEAREQKEREERELEEQAQRARQERMLRLRAQRLRMESEI